MRRPPAPTPQTDTLLTFLPMIAIFVVFYFLLIRPQQKKAKEHGDARGAREGRRDRHRRRHLAGSSRSTSSTLTVEIAPNTQISVQRGAISQLLPKGTIKAL